MSEPDLVLCCGLSPSTQRVVEYILMKITITITSVLLLLHSFTLQRVSNLRHPAVCMCQRNGAKHVAKNAKFPTVTKY